jgi:Bacterial toxin YdaS
MANHAESYLSEESMDEALREAAQAAGGYHALGRRLGISGQAIWQWQHCPAMRVLEIEALTGVSRHRLRPDLYPEVEDNVELPRPLNRRAMAVILESMIDIAVDELGAIYSKDEEHPKNEELSPAEAVDREVSGMIEIAMEVIEKVFDKPETVKKLAKLAVGKWLKTHEAIEKVAKRATKRMPTTSKKP